uniref:hypothetical protein n=1 Tax=Streptomyces marianii TaxID=1817406 RepID=UPI0018F8BB1C|nr:hypothetical protein [Streptomyces marianii]
MTSHEDLQQTNSATRTNTGSTVQAVLDETRTPPAAHFTRAERKSVERQARPPAESRAVPATSWATAPSTPMVSRRVV